MTPETIALARENATKYQPEEIADAYLGGFDRGYNCASWQDMPELGSTVRTDSDGLIEVDADNLWDIVQSLAFMGESNDRDYSPFEFTASAFNRSDDSESLWEAFDAGIADGIQANIDERSKAYGPITDYEVIVGNIGSVYRGSDNAEALSVFEEYSSQSRQGYGRASGEPVTLMADGEPKEEYDPREGLANICPNCNGLDEFCTLCDGRGKVSQSAADEWTRQNQTETETDQPEV